MKTTLIISVFLIITFIAILKWDSNKLITKFYNHYIIKSITNNIKYIDYKVFIGISQILLLIVYLLVLIK